MSHRKILNDAGVACGCETATDRQGREVFAFMCIQHEKDFSIRHAAAVESCSHARRDQNLDLIS